MERKKYRNDLVEDNFERKYRRTPLKASIGFRNGYSENSDFLELVRKFIKNFNKFAPFATIDKFFEIFKNHQIQYNTKK